MLREEIELVKHIVREIVKEEIALVFKTSKEKSAVSREEKKVDAAADITGIAGSADSSEK